MEKLDKYSEDFDFNEFQKEAIRKLKASQSLTGKDGILTFLIKQLIEASLEGELDSHLEDCKIEGVPNRRNGKNRYRKF